MKNIKQIEKIAKAYEQIKKLDAEILQLDKMAMKLADGVGDLTVRITFNEPEKDGVKFDEDGSILPQNTFNGFMPGGLVQNFLTSFQTGGFVGKKDDGYSEKLDENTALNFLGMLISTKMQLRNELIKSIEL